MHFDLIDEVLDQTSQRIRAVKQVSRCEDYLSDHFAGFPVLPGVFMIETMVQAARRLLLGRCEGRMVLGSVRVARYGAMVRPGGVLVVEVELAAEHAEGVFEFKGNGRVRAAGDDVAGGPAETAVSSRFTMRPVRVCLPPAAGQGAN